MTDEITTMRLTEDEMKNLVRNSLMVAGKEMGAEGDHWPVIKNTITDIMRDWENLEVERNVHAEMKKHLDVQLAEMKEQLKICEPDVRADLAPRLQELEDVYNAFFDEVKEDQVYLSDDKHELYLADGEELPVHLKRAEAIIKTLEEEK